MFSQFATQFCDFRNALLTSMTIFFLSLSPIFNSQALGEDSPSWSLTQSSAEARTAPRIGVYVALGNPYPSLLGINGAYNFTPNLRGSLGYGEIEVSTSASINGQSLTVSKSKAQTYNLGAEYLFTKWAVRPAVGLKAGYLSVSSDGVFEIQGFDSSTFLVAANAGLDWIGKSGVYAATGLNLALSGGSGSGFYANVGYFF